MGLAAPVRACPEAGLGSTAVPGGGSDGVLSEADVASTTCICKGVTFGTSLVAQGVKRLPSMGDIRVPSLGREGLLEKDVAPHSSALA